MTAQVGIQYVKKDGSLTEAGYAMIRQIEQENQSLRTLIAALQQQLADAGVI